LGDGPHSLHICASAEQAVIVQGMVPEEIKADCQDDKSGTVDYCGQPIALFEVLSE
jgi:hypothetical protein